MSNESMVQFQVRRRMEISEQGTAILTNGEGSSGNTAHLNLTTPIQLEPYPSIRIPPRWGK